MLSVLHVGCGGDPLPAWLAGYTEQRLDIDPRWNPDILASMTDMGDIGPFQALYSSHSLEHLYPQDVPKALSEFYRVLEPGGFAVVFVPDLEGVELTEDVLFVSPAGPITGLDLHYGFRDVLDEMPHMAHRTRFVRETLHQAMTDAGFSPVEVRRLDNHNLIAAGVKA